MIEPSNADLLNSPDAVVEYLTALEAENDRLRDPWIRWTEARPETPDTYLTYWSDGTVESFPLDPSDLLADAVMIGEHRLLCWALPIAPPTPNFLRLTL